MKANPFDLTGHRAMVTGGTQGVGGAIAVAIANAGADVLLVGLKDDAVAQQTLGLCRDAGVQADLVTADLARPPSEYLDQLLASADAVMPAIDLLVNNAGTYIDEPFLEMDFQRYMTTMHLNVTAGYFLTQAFAQRWVKNKISGRVVFTGSINGFLAEPNLSLIHI